MPRNKIGVKNKSRRKPAVSGGLIDLHFHGAFGVDLMTAEAPRLNALSADLARAGVAGFCPTTLSAPAAELEETVARLGAWIASEQAPGARPLGIHLEGPFLHPDACGAHPPSSLRPLRFEELERLWEASQGTVRILTLAPERLDPEPGLAAVCAWAAKRGVRLSLGHSRATESEARRAFDAGFSGVTHAWNALPFHHRAPGPLGAAFGRKDTYAELIIDGIHVSSEVIRWTLGLHPRVCFVSDCAPAAATTDGRWCTFGALRTRFADGACRLENGALAGGGLLLPEAMRAWLSGESVRTSTEAHRLFKAAIPCATTHPAQVLGLTPRQTQSLVRAQKLAWDWQRLGKWDLRITDSGVD